MAIPTVVYITSVQYVPLVRVKKGRGQRKNRRNRPRVRGGWCCDRCRRNQLQYVGGRVEQMMGRIKKEQ